MSDKPGVEGLLEVDRALWPLASAMPACSDKNCECRPRIEIRNPNRLEGRGGEL